MILFLKTAMVSKKNHVHGGETLYHSDNLYRGSAILLIFMNGNVGSFPSITTVSDDTMPLLTHVMNKCFETHGNNPTAGA